MESVWSVSKLSTESVGSRRELVANRLHRRRRRDKTVSSSAAVCTHHRRDETRQFRRVGVGGVYWLKSARSTNLRRRRRRRPTVGMKISNDGFFDTENW